MTTSDPLCPSSEGAVGTSSPGPRPLDWSHATRLLAAFAQGHDPSVLIDERLLRGCEVFVATCAGAEVLAMAAGACELPTIAGSARAAYWRACDASDGGRAARVVVAPILGAAKKPKGFVVFGASPSVAIDDDFRRFVTLAGSVISATLDDASGEIAPLAGFALIDSLLEDAPVPVIRTRGPAHVLQFVNARARRLLEDRSVVGQPIAEAFFEGLGPGGPDPLATATATGDALTLSEVRVNWLDGLGRERSGYFHVAVQPILDPRGNVDGAVMFAVDVTEWVAARRQLEALVAESRAGDRRKDEFLAMLAHELRNPLAALSGALELMRRGGQDEARAVRLRERCDRQVSQLVRLVDDLLDVSRITRGTIELRRDRVDVAGVALEVVRSAQPQFEDRKLSLTFDAGAGPFRALADPTRLGQVLQNLLSNAAKFTPAGGHVDVRLTREQGAGGPEAVLVVRDDGRGIPAIALPHVFELFMQVDTTLDRSQGGLGIGLTLVRRIVELHGGSVMVTSAGPGCGTEFVVRLPLSDRLPASELPVPVESSGPRRRVVVVEDNDDARELLRELIAALGHEVIAVSNGVDGVQRITALAPDVALVDVGLPGLDGYELARRVRAASGQGIRLVALTGYGGPEALRLSLDAGFDRHVVKPVKAADLGSLLS